MNDCVRSPDTLKYVLLNSGLDTLAFTSPISNKRLLIFNTLPENVAISLVSIILFLIPDTASLNIFNSAPLSLTISCAVNGIPNCLRKSDCDVGLSSTTPLIFDWSPTNTFFLSSYVKKPLLPLANVTMLFMYSLLNWLAAFDKLASPTTTSPFSRMNTFLTSGFCFLNVFHRALINWRPWVVLILVKSTPSSVYGLLVIRLYNVL